MKVYTGARVPIKSWASEVEQGAIDQSTNLANLPFAISHVALMPDAHPGYGMPIGGVLLADNAVVPYAVGVDIGCGVSLLRTSLRVEDLGDRLQQVADIIAFNVPVGVGHGGQHDFDAHPFDWAPLSDLSGAHLSDALSSAMEGAKGQLGTLGSGNHFIELQADPEGQVFVMLHSGSRSVGKKVCDFWHKTARGLNERWHSALPDTELAYLPWDTDQARGYFADMTIAMQWAEQNRRAMLDDIEYSIGEVFGDVAFELVVDIHHNYAAWENHLGRNGIVHRKGAVRARAGETVLIPGSMGTASYVATGLGNPLSFMSCQHGAGRARSRTATLKLETAEQFAESVRGVVLGGKADRARDESPFAYKDIETVMADSTDLVTAVTRMRPLAVVKG